MGVLQSRLHLAGPRQQPTCIGEPPWPAPAAGVAPHRLLPLPRLQVARDKLVALGTCIGKFTHSGKFRLTIGALDVLAQYAKYKVRLSPLLPWLFFTMCA